MKALYIKAPPNVSQHFWHFMMGEFLPVLYVVFKHNYTNVHLVKDKPKTRFPLNSFYQEVCVSQGVTFTISSTPKKGTPYITPLNWDWCSHKEQHKLLWITRYLKQWAMQQTASVQNPRPRRLCIVQDRQNTTVLDKYYKDNETLPMRKSYGSTRRQITNLNNVAQRLQLHYGNTMTVQLLKSDTYTLQQQIMQYVHANVLVLGHGAGMVHLLWMKPRTCVVEIIPRQKEADQNGAVQGCRRLCRILQFRLQRIIVREVKDVVRVKDVIQCLTTMQNHTHGPRRRTKKHYSQLKKKITVAKT